MQLDIILIVRVWEYVELDTMLVLELEHVNCVIVNVQHVLILPPSVYHVLKGTICWVAHV